MAYLSYRSFANSYRFARHLGARMRIAGIVGKYVGKTA